MWIPWHGLGHQWGRSGWRATTPPLWNSRAKEKVFGPFIKRRAKALSRCYGTCKYVLFSKLTSILFFFALLDQTNERFPVGSDVAGLITTAKRSADGKSYLINGEKKWVTQGQKADVGLIAARTGPPTAKGISVFIVPLNSKGISRRKMENSGVNSSGRLSIRFSMSYKFPDL